MPRRKHQPRHRAVPVAPRPRRVHALATLGAVSLCLTGASVTAGVVGTQAADAAGSGEVTSARAADRSTRVQVAAEVAEADAAALAGRRSAPVSRSDRRTGVDRVKKALLDQDQGGQVVATEDLTRADPRAIARAMLPEFGFDSSQFSCLDSLYVSESGWDVHADNPTSSAYGIPQALPGEKMASAGPDWEDDAATQIRWGLGYIQARYGTPCSAWSFKQGNNWY